MLNSCTLKESRTWLLVCTRHCYFIPFNHEHPVATVIHMPITLFISKESGIIFLSHCTKILMVVLSFLISYLYGTHITSLFFLLFVCFVIYFLLF